MQTDTVNVRYTAGDVAESVDFDTRYLGFSAISNNAPVLRVACRL